MGEEDRVWWRKDSAELSTGPALRRASGRKRCCISPLGRPRLALEAVPMKRGRQCRRTGSVGGEKAAPRASRSLGGSEKGGLQDPESDPESAEGSV